MLTLCGLCGADLAEGGCGCRREAQRGVVLSPLVIIGCGKAKRELEPGATVPIRDLYTGSLYRARLAYAEALGGPHYVLSARYGLAPADLAVAAYEDDLSKRPARERHDWTNRAIAQIRRAANPPGQQTIEKRPIVALVAGRYAEWIGALQRDGHDVDVPAEVREDAALDLESPPDYEREAAAVLAELEREEPDDAEEWTIATGTLRALLARVSARKAPSHLADVVRAAVEIGGGQITDASLAAASRALREPAS